MTDDIDRSSVPIGDLDEPPVPPETGEDTATLIEEAMTSLVLLRFPASLGDAAAELHALASLAAEAESRIAGAVADAIDQDYRWSDVAISLGITADEARSRFAEHVRSPKEAPFEE